ncbi:MAG: hypothetical protein BWY94_02017 [Actinobacteria bacterium ADurb.BinA094]|nr:MAG: hypothetical protein BWY94_02017 [Actinobacteria bacterium ADurb.BinA094]
MVVATLSVVGFPDPSESLVVTLTSWPTASKTVSLQSAFIAVPFVVCQSSTTLPMQS